MRRFRIGLALTLMVLGVFLLVANVVAQPANLPSIQSSANDLIAEVNALRVANGLPAYTVNQILMQVAQDQANYMAATGQIAHRPGLTQRLLDAGYPLAGDLSQGGFRAENITGGNKTAAQAVQGWIGDALHTNTMLSPNLSEIGAGVAKVGNTYYMVIECALPTTNGQPQAYTPAADDPAAATSGPSNFIVPITISTPDENGLVYHEVQYGQTLWAIAIEYGVKIDEIRALNNLGPTTDIYQGDRLLIQKDVPPSSVTATIGMSANPSIQTTTPIPFPTVTLLVTKTPTMVIEVQFESPERNSMAGMVIGIALIAILFAGLFSWMSSRRSA
jgi:LysM repeat protein